MHDNSLSVKWCPALFGGGIVMGGSPGIDDVEPKAMSKVVAVAGAQSVTLEFDRRRRFDNHQRAVVLRRALDKLFERNSVIVVPVGRSVQGGADGD